MSDATPRQAAGRPVLTSVAAQLYAADLEVSLGFYTAKLGFSVDFVYGDPPFYAQVSRDQARLALRALDKPAFVDGIRRREELLSASITLAAASEIDRLFLDFEGAGVPFFQRIRNEPWQARTLIVEDPDGNLILFAAPAHEGDRR